MHQKHILWVYVAAACLASAEPAKAQGSIAFFINDPNDYDYGLQLAIPPAFGAGELTFELWIRPDDSFPFGPTASGVDQRTNWSDADNEPYSSGSWWFEGNFLLDGHNNANFQDGTFSLQLYGSGRVRWLFGDGESAGPGGHWSVGAFPATNGPSVVDGAWHQVTLVRRWTGASDAQLELWIDGSLIATETSPARTDLRFWWDAWSGFPADQEGWFWGAEKQAAVGVLDQYEDYKGLVDEVRFWSRAKTAQEITDTWAEPVSGSEPGLVGWFRFAEGAGSTSCSEITATDCIDFVNTQPGFWSAEEAPLGSLIFADGFESGDLTAW
ncbi:MAG: LamG-like jellyroll fold domain-containing protein [Acidobacteriota bacterium]